MAKELIAATQAGATISSISVFGDNLPCTFVASGLAGVETVAINIQIGDATYIPVYQEGTLLELTATNNAITVFGPGEYQVVQSATASNATTSMVSESFK